MKIILLICAIGLILLFRKIREEIEENKLLKQIGSRVENFYIVSRHPITGEDPFLPGLLEVVELTDYNEVYLKAAILEDLLTRSGNKFFSPDIPKTKRLKVYPILFKEGEYINESFNEYALRAAKFIREDRANRHKQLKAASLEWYSRNITKQL